MRIAVGKIFQKLYEKVDLFVLKKRYKIIITSIWDRIFKQLRRGIEFLCICLDNTKNQMASIIYINFDLGEIIQQQKWLNKQ